MGLSNFPSPSDGVIPLLVMNTVMSVALVKSKFRSVLEAVGGGGGDDLEFEDNIDIGGGDESDGSRERRVSITRYGSLCKNRCDRCDGGHVGCTAAECGEDWAAAAGECCCVCLSRFKAEEEVSELSCKHFFHKGCLDKWFHNQHITCPLCRSVV